MKQSRLMSFTETALSTAIGLAVALATQLVVFPLFGWSPPLSTNLAITAIFTVVSIARQFLVRRLFEALHIRVPLPPSVLAIAAERRRQVEVEGFDAAHDAAHSVAELAAAGAAYAVGPGGCRVPPQCWPWSIDWWKPRDTRRDLVRAGALIVAALDRLEQRRRAKR